MNKIKAWKLADLSLQLAGIGLPWLYFSAFPAHERIWHLENLITAYTIAGSIQILSCIANWKLLPATNRTKSRNWYESLLLVLLAMSIIAVVMKSTLLMLMILFYTIPVITIWYLRISITELLNLSNKNDE